MAFKNPTVQKIWLALNNQTYLPLCALLDGMLGGGSYNQLFKADAKTQGALAGSPDYANGTLGQGATLTKHTAGAFPTIDGVAPALGNVYLVDQQAAPAQNGLYVLTVLGDGSNKWVLTRLPGFDTKDMIRVGALVVVAGGTVSKGALMMQNDAVATVGTDAIEFVAFFSGTIDNNAAHITATGAVKAAGSVGKAADAGHVHQLDVASLRWAAFTGVDASGGASHVSIAALKVGDQVFAVYNTTDDADGVGSFESVITVNGQLQQPATDLHLKKFFAIFIAKS